ncbi:TonB-dependent hemoglobin/transferrin/lactoferrin family receptor [Bartonella doshiae]|uniref:TonB-dependent hemoglobin/transferrin/lactoferrin family receptor n=1 Tax=Bartonella doshiae TaxID=33044 RepID=UPI000943124F|nr:TonB-dependent hemoglobin/transferrin/lactoferrin family receptor [Bartonella doshiae]
MPIRRKSIYKNCLILSVLSVCIPSFVFAQNNDKEAVTELRSILIKGKKVEDISSSVNILTDRKTAENIDEKQISDVHEISRLDPSVAYNSKKNSFAIRGLDANRVLITMDGIVLPWLNDILRGDGGNTTFDLNTLSTFDIIQGSDSSLYGSGALGGVIALHTINPEDLITEGKNWGSLIKGGYNSVNNSWRIDQTFAMRAQQTFLLFQGSHTEGNERKNMGTIEGYHEERTRKNPADFDQNNLLLKVHQYFNDTHRFGFTAERFDYSENTHLLNMGNRYSPGSIYDQENKRRERLSLSYDYNGNGDALFDAFRGQLYWLKQSNNDITTGFRVRAPKGDYLRDNLLRDTNYGLNAYALKKVNIGTVSHTLKFATNVVSSQFHHYLLGKDNCHLKENANGCLFVPANRSDSPDTDSYNFGLVFENEIGFAHNRYRITPGIRYDWYKHIPQKTSSYEKALISDKFPPERNGSRLSPKLRMEWDIRNQMTFYAQWAQAFRAPSVSELYVSYIKPSAYYVKGNSDLKAETSNGYDIGIRYGDKSFGSSLSAFVNRYKNFIDIIKKEASDEFPLGRRQYMNRSNVHISGVEARVYLAFNSGLRSNFALVYSQGKDLDKNEYLDSISPLKTVIGLGYAKEFWGADFVLTSSAKRDRVVSESDVQKVPGYNIIDILGWCKPLGEKGPIVRAGVYNLFNTKYWNVSGLPSGNGAMPNDYYSQPGRNFKVSFVQKF